jgi:hypothetical protein
MLHSKRALSETAYNTGKSIVWLQARRVAVQYHIEVEQDVKYVTLLLLLPTSCERLSLARPPMEYNAFASLAHFRILLVPVGSISRKTFDQWAAEIRTLENLRLSDIPPGTKDEKGKHTSSLCASSRAEPSSHSSFYAQPQVQGLFTPMLPHPPTIFVPLRHVSVPTISFPSGDHWHCKLFANRLPLHYNCRIQCRGERSLSP